MEMQQLNGTYPVLGSLLLNGLGNRESSQTPQKSASQSEEQIIETIKNVLMQTESSPEFDHLRLTLGGNEIDLFVVSRPARGMMSQPSEVKKASQPLSIQPETWHDMIHKGVSQIFQHKRFRNDSLMANNPLHKLTIVKQKYQALMNQRKWHPRALSEYQKANILREFLTNCVDEELCPLMDNAQDLSKSPSEAQQRLTQYLILRWQYIDGQPRKEIKKILETEYSCWVRGGTYGRYLEGARKRLSALIWQKEMRALQ